MDFKELSKQLRQIAATLEDMKEVKPERKLPECYVDLPKYKREAGFEEEIQCHRDIEIPMSALSSLYDLRQEYWDIANRSPNWNDESQQKFVIRFDGGDCGIYPAWSAQRFLAFPSMAQAEHFLKHHRDLIEQAKPLL